jgi:hypothetical protein
VKFGVRDGWLGGWVANQGRAGPRWAGVVVDDTSSGIL